MFENFGNQFEGKFGKVGKGMCRLCANGGGIAIKTSSGFKTYNVKTGTLTNVANFCFPMGNFCDEAFFCIPVNRPKVGDILLVDGQPKCVTEVGKKTVKVINYENSSVEEILPCRHIFFGSAFSFTKIVSIFGNMFANGKGANNMMKMMMISEMLGSGNNGSSNNGGFMGNMGQMMAWSMMMGKNDMNLFDGMFDDLDFDGSMLDDESEDIASSNEE